MSDDFFGYPDIRRFVERVLEIRESHEMRTFFDQMVIQAHQFTPSLKDPEKVVRSNIGHCFGEGMNVDVRKRWYDACGAEHPVLGRMDRDLTPVELFRAGFEYGERQSRATSWERLMKDRDDST